MIVGQFGSFIGGFLEQFDGTLEDGDMIFLSDPYSCEGAVSHSNDWLVLLPVFKDGRLIAYTAMFGHHVRHRRQGRWLDADQCALDLRGRRAHSAGQNLEEGRI